MTKTLANDRVERVEVYLATLQQDAPYLGSLRAGEIVNERGYFVRRQNRTVYPRVNRSLVVRILTKDGVEGWGETYGLITPQATAAIINDLLAPFVVDRSPGDREHLHDELYDLMRVRGYTGGYYLDALAAVDIALHDIAGKIAGQSLAELLGGTRDSIPAYISGLPADTLAARCRLANEWQQRGFHRLKFAAPVADEGIAREMKELRQCLGDHAEIACDMHWAFTPTDAVELARQMAPERPWFLEAPVAPEDIDGLRWVAQYSEQQIAAGEHWRTDHEARLAIDGNALQIAQPEMGHTGVTQFMRIGRRAEARGLQIMPHATIGAGIFLAASLQASTALRNATCHEYQHSVFEPVQEYTSNILVCERGAYRVPNSPGLGVEPSAEMRGRMELIPA